MTDPCATHPCDRCPLCLAGTCCGELVVDTDLPREGSYPELHVPVGSWDETESGIKCHACGERHHDVGSHARKHRLTHDQYRAVFGLKVTRPLVSTRIREARSERAIGQAAEVLAQNRPTNEQLSVIGFQREQRAEVRVTRSKQKQFTPEFLREMSRRRVQKWNGNPAFREESRQRMLKARRRRLGDTSRHCPICECWFCPVPGTGRQIKTCRTKECLQEVRRRNGAAVPRQKRTGRRKTA